MRVTQHSGAGEWGAGPGPLGKEELVRGRPSMCSPTSLGENETAVATLRATHLAGGQPNGELLAALGPVGETPARHLLVGPCAPVKIRAVATK